MTIEGETVESGRTAARASGPAWPREAWWIAAATPALLGPAWVFLAARLWPETALASVAGFVLVALVATCAVTDTTLRKIPNWATYTATAWALALSAAPLLGWRSPRPAMVEPVDALLGLLACFFVMLLVYRASGSGAGDVKLAGAIGALLGPERGLNALVLAYLVAGVTIVIALVWTMGPARLFGGLFRRIGSVLLPGLVARPSPEQEAVLRRPIPLAAFFALGALLSFTGVAI